MIQKLLALRRQLKAKKPDFIREDADKKSIGIKWRRPTGRHSKIKHQFKGSRKMPSCGYRSPLLVRGLLRQGLRPIVIHTPEELAKIDPVKDIIVLGKSVGKRKRIVLLQNIIEKKLPIANVKNPLEALRIMEKKPEEKYESPKKTGK